ncbi:MAG: hypothetical protein K1X94_19765 [Sandaracinaceae bacterium]|nr:hypothetical protein [Sandaracinaceae bacterium]
MQAERGEHGVERARPAPGDEEHQADRHDQHHDERGEAERDEHDASRVAIAPARELVHPWQEDAKEAEHAAAEDRDAGERGQAGDEEPTLAELDEQVRELLHMEVPTRGVSRELAAPAP